MDRRGPDLALELAAVLELDALVDLGGELVVVAQHAVEAQDVGDEVVGEDREAVDVRERGDAASWRSLAVIWARL
jgi:hypothetical protein